MGKLKRAIFYDDSGNITILYFSGPLRQMSIQDLIDNEQGMFIRKMDSGALCLCPVNEGVDLGIAFNNEDLLPEWNNYVTDLEEQYSDDVLLSSEPFTEVIKTFDKCSVGTAYYPPFGSGEEVLVFVNVKGESATIYNLQALPLGVIQKFRQYFRVNMMESGLRLLSCTLPKEKLQRWIDYYRKDEQWKEKIHIPDDFNKCKVWDLKKMRMKKDSHEPFYDPITEMDGVDWDYEALSNINRD